ncbi:MAG TPA: hypothetical protein PLM75_13430, partial [bacterium]|nr:hypothetical protein [bacterium]
MIIINALLYSGLYYYLNFTIAKKIFVFWTASILVSALILILLISKTANYASQKFTKKLIQEIISLDIQEITDALKNYEKDGIDFAFSKFMRALTKIHNSLEKNTEQYNELKNKIKNFSEELEMLKLNTDTSIKTSLINIESISKITNDSNDFIFIQEHFFKVLKTEFNKSIEEINTKFKQKEKLGEFFNQLVLAMKDIEALLNSADLFCSDFEKNQNIILTAISEMLANIEKQSINILNFYIFSHPEKLEETSETGEDTMNFERDENINNIKNINEAIKNEIYKIKNTLTILFETNKNFYNSLLESRKTFVNLISYLNEIPSMLEQFNKTDLTIKNNLLKFLNSAYKFNEKLKKEGENLKNLNIKLN